MRAIHCFNEGVKVIVEAGKYQKVFGPTAIEEAFASRAKKGIVLPRTLKKTTAIFTEE